MTDTKADAKPTTEELYGLATSAGRSLVVKQRSLGNADMLIAAGVVAAGARERRRQQRSGKPAVVADALVLSRSDEALAPMLFRLHVEWDEVKSQHALAMKRQDELQEQIDTANKELARLMLEKVPDMKLIEDKAGHLKLMRKKAEGEAITEYHLMLSKLRTLTEVREALWRWACIQASKFPLIGLGRNPPREKIVAALKSNPVGSDEVVRAITSRVLKAFLDPNCRGCNGTKQVFQALRGKKGKANGVTEGRYGLTHLVACGACRGTGLARGSLGETDGERRFAAHLLDRMQVMLLAVERDMRNYLHANPPTPSP